MYLGPPQQHLGGMTPFAGAPSLAVRVLGHTDPQLDRARRHARLRRRARRQRPLDD